MIMLHHAAAADRNNPTSLGKSSSHVSNIVVGDKPVSFSEGFQNSQKNHSGSTTATTRPDVLKAKKKWSLPLMTPRASLPSGALLKDLKRSMTEFVGPFFGSSSACYESNLNKSDEEKIKREGTTTTMHLLDEVVDPLLNGGTARQHQQRLSKSAVNRPRSSSLLTPLPDTTHKPSDPSRSLDFQNCDPFVTPSEFREQLISNTQFRASISPSFTSYIETACRKQLTTSELVLEELKMDVAVRLALAQSLSQSTEASEEELGEQCGSKRREDETDDVPSDLSDDVIDLDDNWGADASNAEQILNGVGEGNEIAVVKEMNDERKSSADQREERRNPINEFLQLGMGRRLVIDHEKDPVKRCEKMVKREEEQSQSEQDEDVNMDRDIYERADLRLGALSIGMTTVMESVFPSKATNEVEYIIAILKCPVLCFKGSLSFEDSGDLPHIKQDAKDLTRDIVQINGNRISGSKGYKHIYRELAKELLPSELVELYTERELIIESKDVPAATGNPSSVQEDYQSVNEVNGNNNGVDDAFSLAEIQALILLHFVNRTLAGGHCFEKVMDVFGKNGDISLVVPNSTAAKPLDIILPRNSKGNPIAILRSHNNFRIVPAATSDPLSVYAEVDAHFIADVDCASITNELTIHKVCRQLLEESQLENHQNNSNKTSSSESILPPRLLSFILSKASIENASTLNASSSKPVDYRIYLSTSATPSN